MEGTEAGPSSGSNPNVSEALKSLGRLVAEDARKDGGYIPPLLAAFIARCITLEQPQFDIFQGLEPEQEKDIIGLSLERCVKKDDPIFETVKMQVTFESLYATELHRLRQEQVKRDQSNNQQLDKIVQIGTNLQSNAQVASLYRSIFKLMLANSCVDEGRRDRNVEREIAAALESVFPQAGLNAFNMMMPDEKTNQIRDLVNIVLGIRLFNREIKKGGAGIVDIPGMVSTDVDKLYEELELESTEMGDICYTYSDIINLEFEKSGSIAASLSRLQEELTNRRQYILLIHQLQHEVLESIDVIKAGKQQLFEEMEQLKTLVGLRTSVPKEQVYPKFHVLAGTWKALIREREKTAMRGKLLEQLLMFKDNFSASLLDDDIELVKQTPVDDSKQNLDPDSFVTTLAGGASAEDEKMAGTFDKCTRLVKETTPDFMSLPLEHQGYCPWTIVTRQGLLLPGNPNLGIIRYKGKHFSFVSDVAMRDFVVDPEKYIEGVVIRARQTPALIHLLCLQQYVPNSDISELFSIADIFDNSSLTTKSTSKCDAGIQTPSTYINTDAPDPNYEWNEWAMRRKALQMADLCNKRTHSTQTVKSHFRRSNDAQTYVKLPDKDGVMPGKSTQTGIEKGTNVERSVKYITGLRGRPDSQVTNVQYVTKEFVQHGCNAPLNRHIPRGNDPVGIDV